MKPNYLVIVDSKAKINDLRALNVNLVMPLKSFSVGYSETLELEEIQSDDYILVNAEFDNQMLSDFKKLINGKKIKGILFNDLGLIEILNKQGIETILINNHLLTNYESVNMMLSFVNTVLISTDITNEEVKNILRLSSKPLVVYGFGLINIMYSKRHLLTNYAKYQQIEYKNNLEINNGDKHLLVIENSLGTVIYDLPYLDNLQISNEANIKYILINSLELTINELKQIIINNKCNTNVTKGFSETKTTYKVKE